MVRKATLGRVFQRTAIDVNEFTSCQGMTSINFASRSIFIMTYFNLLLVRPTVEPIVNCMLFQAHGFSDLFPSHSLVAQLGSLFPLASVYFYTLLQLS